MRISLNALFTVGAVAYLLLAADAHAITLNMTYFNEGDPVPHDENPSWDPAGTILKAHFQAAKAIWEYLLPGGGSYDLEFEWDDDIGSSTLGLTTPGFPDFIEINPLQLWFADPTPGDSNEFNTPTQRLYSQLSSSDQSTYFPGTAPPGALEVNYQATGIANGTIVSGVPVNTLSLSGQTFVNSGGATVSVDASNGNDLLSTIVHEIGHVLGIGGIEPGDYNIYPQHVGGLNNVLVLEGGGGHLGGGFVGPPTNFNIVPGFLMCNSCGVPGLRRFATGTDILVIAEDQGITVVQLARVGSISSGNWSTTSNWIGGDVPDGTQDVYLTHGGIVTVDVGAQAQSLFIAPSNGIVIQAGQSLLTNGTLTFTGGSLTAGSGGSFSANTFVGNPGSIFTAAGSLVRFNQFTEVSPTSASFNGSLAIGFDNITGPLSPTQPTTFNPILANWNIAENLIVGDETFANLIVDNGSWAVNGNVTLGNVLTALNGGWSGGVALKNDGVMTIDGNLDIPLGAVTVEDTATLNVSGNITIGKQSGITYRDNRKAANKPYSLPGGQTVIVEGTPIRIAGAYLTFEDSASAGDATVVLEGGSGDGAAGGLVAFRGDSSAGDTLPLARALFRTKGGHFGPSFSGVMMGSGGQVRFEGTSGASTSTFINEGCHDSVPFNWQYGGTGGRTIFTNNSSAEQAEIHNHGASTPIALIPLGGATHFFDFSTAGSANITNHADATFHNPGAEATTVFYDSSDAGNATIENEGAAVGSNRSGQTEFRGNSSAALSNIHNRAHPTPGGPAGRTLFYDSATAADATIHTYEGYSDHGRVEFHDQSTAGRSRIIMENVHSVSNGGYVNFFDNSTAAQSQIFVRAGVCCSGGIRFNNNTTAADAQVLTEDGSGNIAFLGNSTAGDPASAPTAAKALFTLGQGSVISFYDTTKAEDAGISLAHGAQLQFQNNSSAGQATIAAAGSSLYPVAGGRVLFNSTSLINNSTIIAGGGTASLAAGATVEFINGAHAGNATITANGGSNGGTGAQITFNSNAKGDNARIIANAGSTVDFLDQQFYTGGAGTTLGSIEGAGKFVLRGSLLTVGSLNLSTTVSGPIIEHPFSAVTGGRLTKVGTGTLTLAGTNTYSGLTTVNSGALNVTGSIAGGAVVNNGGTLGGNGTIAGNVTVNSGGIFAPGTSPGIIAVGSLTMNAGATLQMELGGIAPGTGYDRIQSSGALALAGTLQVSLIDGFTPSAGQSFDLFNWGSTSGTFASLALPALAGLAWNTSQLYTTGVLILDAAAIPGDFDNNGKVDAADFVVWRKNGGTPQEFNAWRANFGIGAGSGSGASVNTTVPEPATLAMLLMVMLAAYARRRTYVS